MTTDRRDFLTAALTAAGAWAEAYRHTPHGQPVELSAAAAEPDHQ